MAVSSGLWSSLLEVFGGKQKAQEEKKKKKDNFFQNYLYYFMLGASLHVFYVFSEVSE